MLHSFVKKKNGRQYPITATNRGALTERWVVRMTNSTSFEVIGENVGVIATGNTSADCAPNNPATGVPYFRLPALGWGNGWATGNVLRFNTIGSQCQRDRLRDETQWWLTHETWPPPQMRSASCLGRVSSPSARSRLEKCSSASNWRSALITNSRRCCANSAFLTISFCRSTSCW